jgi:hypothetical protein
MREAGKRAAAAVIRAADGKQLAENDALRTRRVTRPRVRPGRGLPESAD